MESLRWILLAAGVAALAGILWLYFRHKSEQAIELGSGRTDANHDDPIDVSIRQPVDDPTPAAGNEVEETPELSAVRRVAIPRREPTLDGDQDRPEIEPFAVEPQPLRWKQPTFTRPNPDLQPEASDETLSEGILGTVRRTVLDNPQPTSGSLFRHRQPTAHFNYQQKPHAEENIAPDLAHEDTATPPHAEPTPPAREQRPASAESLVIALLIAHPEGLPFAGNAVQELIEDIGFEYGAMSIYHYLDEFGQTLFSLMNGIKPGLFDRGDVTSFNTPLLALFMQVPLPGQSENLVLDRLIDVARDMAAQLGGEVLDDQRAPLTSESIDRYREQLTS
ncbi:cell division protein ZipA C-terminal FtsZ-binding domain-containing protein [Halothiobacillus sp. DCM-1]|uniref:cell division protein ZipA C-terminal FtsZ-binding domain-containing protein n=1 Tax=Halothiobacillus sp. DCM-1 TaxID=3112558 RepID=UPI0032444CA5